MPSGAPWVAVTRKRTVSLARRFQSAAASHTACRDRPGATAGPTWPLSAVAATA